MDLTTMKVNKLGRQLAQILHQIPKPVCIVNRNNVHDAGLSDGTSQGDTFRRRYTAVADCNSIKLVYANFHTNDVSGGIDTDNPDDVTYKASIEFTNAAGTIVTSMHQVRFGGKKTVTIASGGFVESDELGIEITAGTKFFIRTSVSVDTMGKKWVKGNSTNTYLATEGRMTASADTTENSSTTAVAFYSGSVCPIAIISNTAKNNAVLIAGDSIASGSGDSSGDAEKQLTGYIQQPFAGKNPLIVISRVNDRAYTFANMANRLRRMVLAKYCKYAICNYGINDIPADRTLVQLQTDLINIWTMLVKRGLKVYGCTVTPKTSSTDSWATTVNQTKTLSAGQETIRTQLNDWIRTCPAPLSGYFEPADLAETSRNSGIWKAGYTADGVHPNTTGATALKNCIDTSLFV